MIFLKISLILFIIFLSNYKTFAQEFKFALGDTAITESDYKDTLGQDKDFIDMSSEDLSFPARFDARTYGWVTTPKDQGSCGSCWAFASVGTMESRILKEFGTGLDLSEQQQISCNMNMKGCLGGGGFSLKFYLDNKPCLENCTGYPDRITKGKATGTPCETFSCPNVNYIAKGFYTVKMTENDIKRSILLDGPCYFRYDVYSDFYVYWSDVTSEDKVYRQKNSEFKGGHAVLIIGWDDTKQAWLLKNSWGNTGPNGDGSFWVAYHNHANDLNFQMFNFDNLEDLNSKSIPTVASDILPDVLKEIRKLKNVALSETIRRSAAEKLQELQDKGKADTVEALETLIRCINDSKEESDILIYNYVVTMIRIYESFESKTTIKKDRIREVLLKLKERNSNKHIQDRINWGLNILGEE
jgi:hypothetical protein